MTPNATPTTEIPVDWMRDEQTDESGDESLFPSLDDDELLTGAPDGPAIDWEAALEENATWLRTVIAARVGEAAAVDDVFQEVSLAAIRQKAPISDRTKVAPWLYRLAVLQSLLYRRTMGRKRKLINRFTEQVPVTEHDQHQMEPLQWLLARERQEKVREAMKTLPKREQELLMLKYVHEWSYKEMADKLGLSVSAVQARLHRARGLLRERLAKYDLEP
ncbi:MAG: RNA polymerase sigma factor [Planctomycetia bacterium]|nr:RNA polymerase sigma factor [Planctomycetia bacterium]